MTNLAEFLPTATRLDYAFARLGVYPEENCCELPSSSGRIFGTRSGDSQPSLPRRSFRHTRRLRRQSICLAPFTMKGEALIRQFACQFRPKIRAVLV